ncbi:MAG: phosphoribosylaminoimidazolesuccinocarboxamide synthase [Methanobacteriota archaeon]|nr:MAG: phosphoribosylaminoimidazolesuccinocarboxamide synthase [Euryarchaeota archaeon]
MKLIYEGKVKAVYDAGGGKAVIVFRDDITAGDGAKRETMKGKGAINAEISARLMEVLEEEGIETHFIEYRRPDRMVVRKVEIIPLEVIVRNVAAGSLVRRYPFREGQRLDPPVVEFGYKSDEYHDPMLNDDIALALGLCTREELEHMRATALRINDVLKGFFSERGIILVDFKVEFGRADDGRVILADEISPDTCRFWDAETGDVMDKDRFRRDMGDVMGFYRALRERVLAG